ncbi:japanin-like-RA2 [Dermacentor variabilis]|uniref:japanin-like-RA2 n=1 Tax=Dermacentor variabilis TaxID=34621 RepID=UPI003F5B2193
MHTYAFIKVKKYPVFLHVQNTSALVEWTNAKPRYLIRYYDNNSLVLSDLIDKISELTPCSLWVTREYINKVPLMANETFYHLCKHPVYVGFSYPCF